MARHGTLKSAIFRFVTVGLLGLMLVTPVVAQ